MKRTIRASLALAFMLAAPAALATPTGENAQTERGESAADPAAIDAARAAVSRVDTERLLRDRDYAGETLGHLDVLEGGANDSVQRLGIDMIRLFALMTLQRHDDIRLVIDRTMAARPAMAEAYPGPWWAALSIPDYARAVTVVEQASRNLPGVAWGRLRETLGPSQPSAVLQQLRQDHDDVNRVRLAEALFRIGWPGDGDREGADFLRTILLDSRLARGERAVAADLAAGISTTSGILPLILLRRYDAILAEDTDRLAMLRAALDANDRETALAIAGPSPNQRQTLDRVRFLRGLGREAEALTLLGPFMRDVAATVAASEYGMWLINDAAYSLLKLDRNDEAVALMARLVALPIADNAGLIGPFINHSIILGEAGRHAEALAHARRLEADFSQFANGYGKMWIAASIVRELVALGRAAEAPPVLARMRATGDDNPSALTFAYLCLNDMAAAEALIIRRLESDDPESAVLALQDYRLGRDDDPDPVFDRLMILRDRPAVRAALERVGRMLELPLARSYWGGV